MSRYKIDKQDGVYFITFTTVGWVDLFIRDVYKKIIADSLNFFINERGSYLIMPSRLHLIASVKENNLSTVVGSFKNIQAGKVKMVQQTHESRREWLLPIYNDAGEKKLRNKNYQVWQQDNHPVEVYSLKFTLSKLINPDNYRDITIR
jgi:hypothetical protein